MRRSLKRQSWLAATLLLWLAVAPAGSAATLTPGLAWTHVDELATNIGSRPAGSDNSKHAAAYISRTFESFGLWSSTRDFPVTVYTSRSLWLGVDGVTTEATSLQYATTGDVQGRLVDVGLGRVGDFDAARLAGNIALIERGEIRFYEKVGNVAAAGAVGAIIYNNLDGSFSGSLARTSAIPALSIGRADGLALRAAANAGTSTARIVIDAAITESAGQNVSAVKPGGPKKIIIGGHYDSVAAGPGANDNASGIAVLLEVARVLASTPTRHTYQFSAYDAEEIGLIGSRHDALAMTEVDRQATLAMINIDMVGVGSAPRFGGTPRLVALASAVAEELGQTPRTFGGASFGAGSDHSSFESVGVPNLFVHRSDDPNYHGPGDVASAVRTEHLDFAARLVLRIVEELERED